MGTQKQDPLDKIGKLIDDRISEAFNSRDQRQREEKDPWARIEGVVDRAVARAFDAFAKGLEEGEKRERGGGRGRSDDDDQEGDEERPKLGIFGL